MVLRFQCVFGVDLKFYLEPRFGSKVEISALEFLNGAPIEWRLRQDGIWRPGLRSGHASLRGFHDMQIPRGFGTSGTLFAHAILETRGIGDATVMIWLRDRTYSETRSQLQIL